MKCAPIRGAGGMAKRPCTRFWKYPVSQGEAAQEYEILKNRELNPQYTVYHNMFLANLRQSRSPSS